MHGRGTFGASATGTVLIAPNWQVLTIISMLQEGHALFYRPKDKKMHADKAHKNFWKPGGDHFAMLNIWEQWVDTNFSQQ